MVDALYDLIVALSIASILLNVMSNGKKLDKIDKKLSEKKITRNLTILIRNYQRRKQQERKRRCHNDESRKK